MSILGGGRIAGGPGGYYYDPRDERSDQLVRALYDGWQQQNTLQKAGLLPVVGDAAGLLGDIQMMVENPDERTWGNAALSALGLLPFVPAGLGTTMKNAFKRREWKTSDGYHWYEQPDGSITDTPNPEDADLGWESFEQLKDFAEDEVFEVGDELGERRVQNKFKSMLDSMQDDVWTPGPEEAAIRARNVQDRRDSMGAIDGGLLSTANLPEIDRWSRDVEYPDIMDYFSDGGELAGITRQGRSTTVLKNPPERTIQRLGGRNRDEMRSMVDNAGDLYVWRSGDAIHDQIQDALGIRPAPLGSASDVILEPGDIYGYWREVMEDIASDKDYADMMPNGINILRGLL